MAKSSALLKNKRNQVLGIIFIIVVLGLLALGVKYVFKIKPKAAGANCKYLISYGVSHNGAYPEYIGVNPSTGVSNLQNIEALPEFPYNGVGIETSAYYGINAMHKIMLGSSKLGYDAIRTQYKPLIDLGSQGIHPTKLKHNFLMVHLEDAGGFYNPSDSADKATRDAQWANVADNFANLARVAKEVNDSGFPIDGIFLDNEGPYGAADGFWHCGGTFAPACSSTNLAAYQEQVRHRGQQIMTAIVSYSYPNMRFMFMHSTDVSCTLDPNDRRNPAGLGPNWVEYANQLLGPFTIGLAESAKGSSVKVVDGGEESYGYLTQDYFTVSKDYRDKGMSSQMDGTKLACYFIPPEDRTTVQTWSDLFETAFAMYNQDPASTPGQTVDTIQQSMKLALENTDNYVWFYLEGGITTIGVPNATQIDQTWTHNIKLARDAVVNDPSCDAAPTSPTPPTPSPSPSPTPSPTPSAPTPTPSLSPSPSPSPSSPPKILNLQIQLQGRTDYGTTNTHLKIYDSTSTLVLDKTDVSTDASGNAQITLPTSMTVGSSYSFFTKPKYFLGDYKGGQVLTNPMNLTYAVFKGGDLDDNNMINTLDFSIMNSKWLQNDPIADVNKDGIVNTIDFAFLSANWLIGT